MSQRPIRFTDVSFTDGQSAVWFGAMTTPMALAAASSIARARPAAIEVASPATLCQCLAHGEDPWQRIELLRERCAPVPLRATIALLTEHGRCGTDVLSTEVATQWLRELAQRGVSEVLLVDPLLQIERIAPLLRAATALSMTAIGALPFVADALRSDDFYRMQAAALVAAGAARVMLRDESGVLTPERMATLIPALCAGLGATPLDMHLRCQTALGPLNALEAVRFGGDGLDTAFAPLANGASVPALGTLVKALRTLGQTVNEPDMDGAAAANRQLSDIADRHGFASALPWVFDLAPYAHQLPGEVAAVAMQRLAASARLRELHAFADECARVRAELGTPPMLAPFARAIAEQALSHFEGAPRYAELRPGVRRALQQLYGAAPGPIDAGLLKRLGTLSPPQPQGLAALRAANAGATDAALVLAQVCGVAPQAQPRPTAREALQEAVHDLATTPEEVLWWGLLSRGVRYAELNVQGPGVAIRLRGSKE